MASWTKRSPAGTSARRRWDLEGKFVVFWKIYSFFELLFVLFFKDQHSLKNLKNHFAANGCPDVQFDVAKQLLENACEYC